MGVIEPRFKPDDVRKRLDAFLDAIQRAQIKRLQRIGEKCLTYARESHPNDWQDQTGNLRSSIGYMVFVNGQAVHNSSFEQVSARETRDGVAYDGGKKGENFCRRIGQGTTGVALVVVAGMDYAVHVESHGRDVLTGAEHLAEQELPKELEKLIDNIKQAAE